MGYQSSEKALALAEECRDILSLGSAYINHGISCYSKGDLEGAKHHLLRGLNFYAALNVHVWKATAHLYLGEIYFEIEKYQESMDHYRQASLILEDNNIFSSLSNLNKIGIAKAKVMSGETDIKLELLVNYVHENKTNIFKGWIQKYIGEVLLHIDDQHISEAEDWIKKAIETDKSNDMIWNLARDYALYAELFKRKDDFSKARENLNKAIEIFKECGADGWVEKYEKELATLS